MVAVGVKKGVQRGKGLLAWFVAHVFVYEGKCVNRESVGKVDPRIP